MAFLILFTAALAAASLTCATTTSRPGKPVTTPRQGSTGNPWYVQAWAYNLWVNVTHGPAADFSSHPVHGMWVSLALSGATTNAPTLISNSSLAAIFSTTLRPTLQLSTSFGNNTTPYSLSLDDQALPNTLNPHILSVGVNAGSGTEGLEPSDSEVGCVRLLTPKLGFFAVCDMKFEAYAHPQWLVVFVEGDEETLPTDCVAISLLPVWNGYDLGWDIEGDEIQLAGCYDNPAEIVDWSVYGC
ncbi:hypothetical protein B0H66DRAFT_601224 [Apodospora peruviana]|uniref:DUF7907 domain-containing protein n=1 Tax=Apodospora peruviana TaxID=516989 RepID=A0AAE0ICH8_9PEZI|nr:hypothetical protein B0H66DRAFT_601224 [Apodospora peruviana]